MNILLVTETNPAEMRLLSAQADHPQYLWLQVMGSLWSPVAYERCDLELSNVFQLRKNISSENFLRINKL